MKNVFTRSSLRGRSARLAATAAMAAAAVTASGCGSELMREGQASSYLIVQSLVGNAATSGAASYSSDVITQGSVYEDLGQVTLSAAMKDVTNPNQPTTNNAITINRYRVTYRRSDGRNTQGVDVPYAFDGAVTATVEPGGSITIPFVIVRAQAKLEAPLSALAGGGGHVVISTLTDVTFFGRDQTGREVTVSGSVSLNFADWADDED